MSDIEDDFDDDFELGDYFYVEDTSDEVGDLAERAVASPPPFEDSEDTWDWDRFAYWNDIEYDSDGYHDIDTDRTSKRKRKGVQPPLKGKLKRRLDHHDTSPAKRRKGRAGTSHAARERGLVPEILVSPVGWRDCRNVAHTPLRASQEEPFALLKDWREQFPESRRPHEGGSDPDIHGGPDNDSDDGERRDEVVLDGEPQTLHVGQEAILAALRANLGKLTGGAGGEALGAEEDMLIQHITQMLSGEGVSLDDIAGDLADTLFAPDSESVASDPLHESQAEGGFGQWVLKQAEDQAGPSSGLPELGELSPHSDGASQLHHDPADNLTEHRPPTPASLPSAAGSSKGMDLLLASPHGVDHAETRHHKRKADSIEDHGESSARAKRGTTHSFDAPTASSRARSLQAAGNGKPAGKMAARKASKAAKK